jgi:serine protease Do
LKAAVLVVLLALSTSPAPEQNLAILAPSGAPICGAVLVEPDLVLTAAHCVDEGMFAVRCLNNDLPGDVESFDADEDLATVRLITSCSAPLSRVAKSNPPVGASVRAQGYPYGHFAMSHGIVSGYEMVGMPPYDGQEHEPRSFLKTDTAIDPGNSGGGMYNTRGELVGICSMSRSNFGFYSPASRIRSFLTGGR